MFTYGSFNFSINKEELIKVAKGLAIAAIGGVITYATTFVLPELAKSPGFLAVIVYPLASAAVNFARKFVLDNTDTVVSNT